MRQDPNAVPHPRASYEQISYRQPPAQRPPYKQTPDQQEEGPGHSTYDAASRDVGDAFPAYPPEPRPFRQFQPPWRQDARPTSAQASAFGGWPGTIQPQSADQETEATLARVRVAQRKAKRMQVVCVLLGVCAAALFLVAAASHQLDGHIEMLMPVLLLTSAVNFRRCAQRVAKYRATEADILARVI